MQEDQPNITFSKDCRLPQVRIINIEGGLYVQRVLLGMKRRKFRPWQGLKNLVKHFASFFYETYDITEDQVVAQKKLI